MKVHNKMYINCWVTNSLKSFLKTEDSDEFLIFGNKVMVGNITNEQVF